MNNYVKVYKLECCLDILAQVDERLVALADVDGHLVSVHVNTLQGFRDDLADVSGDVNLVCEHIYRKRVYARD